jgi:hypothetical protein
MNLPLAIAADGFTRIRQYLEHPPRYESLLIQRTLAAKPISFRSEREAKGFLKEIQSGAVALPSEKAWFEIRYQSTPPAFLLRTLSDPDQYGQITSHRQAPLAGRYDSDWWSILDVVPGQIQILRSLDGRDVTTEGVTNAYHFGNERWATEFLRLGMFEVLPDTIRWHPGNRRFESVTEGGGPCLGRIEGKSEETEATLWLEFPGSGSGKRIQIESKMEAGRWLPSRVLVDRWTGSAAAPVLAPYATFVVLAQAVADAPIPRERFSPEPYLRTNDLWVEIERGKYFSLEMVGTNLIRTLAPPLKYGWGLRDLARGAFLVAVLVGGLWLVRYHVLEWRRRCRA